MSLFQNKHAAIVVNLLSIIPTGKPETGLPLPHCDQDATYPLKCLQPSWGAASILQHIHILLQCSGVAFNKQLKALRKKRFIAHTLGLRYSVDDCRTSRMLIGLASEFWQNVGVSLLVGAKGQRSRLQHSTPCMGLLAADSRRNPQAAD